MLTEHDLTDEHIERIKTALNREPIVCRLDNRIRVKDVDYEGPINVFWPGAVEGHVWREREGWHWTVEHLWRDETLLAEGTAPTKQYAVDDMVDALIREARDGASRRDVFRAWTRGTVKIV